MSDRAEFDEAMEAFVSASGDVTDLLMRLAEGKGVDPTEIKAARDAEVKAIGKYVLESAGHIVTTAGAAVAGPGPVTFYPAGEEGTSD